MRRRLRTIFLGIESIMDVNHHDDTWAGLSYVEKNHQLFLRQKQMLDTVWKHGAISREQHDKSLHDLAEKMNEPLDE